MELMVPLLLWARVVAPEKRLVLEFFQPKVIRN